MVAITLRTPLHLLGVSALSVVALLAFALVDFGGSIRLLPQAPEQRLRNMQDVSHEWLEGFRSSVVGHSAAQRATVAALREEPQLAIPQLHSERQLLVPPTVLETLAVSERSYRFIIEVPAHLADDARADHRRRIATALLDWEARMVELRKKGTPFAPWHFDANAAFVDLSLDASLAVARDLAGAAARPPVDVAAVLFASFGRYDGMLDLPEMVFAHSPEQSGTLTGLSPLRMIPVYAAASATGAPEESEFFAFSPTIWESVSLLRSEGGEAIDFAPGIGFAPTTSAPLVVHLWAPYALMDGHCEDRVGVARAANCLPHLMAQLAFSFKSGVPLRSPESAALVPDEFRATLPNIDPVSRRPPVVNWVIDRLYGPPGTRSDGELRELPGIRALNVIP